MGDSPNSKVEDTSKIFYKVEKILEKRIKISKKGTKVFMYKIKWEDHPDVFNSWEPEENLTSDLIENFSLSQKQAVNMEVETHEGLGGKHLHLENEIRESAGSKDSNVVLKKTRTSQRQEQKRKRKQADNDRILKEIKNKSGSKRLHDEDKTPSVSKKKKCIKKNKKEVANTENDDESYIPEKKRSMLKYLVAKKIIGVAEYNGSPVFLMEWEGPEEPDF